MVVNALLCSLCPQSRGGVCCQHTNTHTYLLYIYGRWLAVSEVAVQLVNIAPKSVSPASTAAPSIACACRGIQLARVWVGGSSVLFQQSNPCTPFLYWPIVVCSFFGTKGKGNEYPPTPTPFCVCGESRKSPAPFELVPRAFKRLVVKHKIGCLGGLRSGDFCRPDRGFERVPAPTCTPQVAGTVGKGSARSRMLVNDRLA